MSLAVECTRAPHRNAQSGQSPAPRLRRPRFPDPRRSTQAGCEAPGRAIEAQPGVERAPGSSVLRGLWCSGGCSSFAGDAPHRVHSTVGSAGTANRVEGPPLGSHLRSRHESGSRVHTGSASECSVRTVPCATSPQATVPGPTPLHSGWLRGARQGEERAPGPGRFAPPGQRPSSPRWARWVPRYSWISVWAGGGGGIPDEPPDAEPVGMRHAYPTQPSSAVRYQRGSLNAVPTTADQVRAHPRREHWLRGGDAPAPDGG